MVYQTLVGKITEYMHLSTSVLSKWLGRRLPDVLGDNWWNEWVEVQEIIRIERLIKEL